ncbi:MAG TPA: hypothetical protein PLQ44_01005 [Candidatus Paceibacterota bacterium]|nr:hypothetical protein [Candidatus Paceibacterota bacterium]HPT40166.1 hypothetical protein [Candidatus Paceibacterota bacterium]
MLRKFASQSFNPKDFSVGLMQEMLITLCRFGFSPEMAKKIASTETGMAKKVCGLFLEYTKDEVLVAMKKAWEIFYLSHFSLSLDLSNLVIPECPGVGWRLLVIARDVTLDFILHECRNTFNVQTPNFEFLPDLVISERRNKNFISYAVWVKDIENSNEDKNLARFCAADIEAKGLATETLEERLIHEFVFFKEKGRHLDVSSITLCAGSRRRGVQSSLQDVWSVHWNKEKEQLEIGLFGPHRVDGNLCARRVICD